jgi:hypothetical protein
LEDGKRAVDDLRLRVWANITASGASDPAGVVSRFRLQRTIDLCRQVDQDLEGYPPGAHHRELLELRQLTHYLMLRLTKLARGSG